MIVFGIDPGMSGAIAEYDPSTGQLSVYDTPTMPNAKGKEELNHHAVLDLLTTDGSQPVQVWLERVGARPGQGVSSMFRFGQGFGALEMAVAACGHQLRYVTPAAWKKHFSLSADKGAARSVAMQRFPAQAQMFARVKDDGRAEAALIALYGWEVSK